jgi:hypothetical protein
VPILVGELIVELREKWNGIFLFCAFLIKVKLVKAVYGASCGKVFRNLRLKKATVSVVGTPIERNIAARIYSLNCTDGV